MQNQSSLSNKCPICFDNINGEKKLICNHSFCNSCITPWINQQRSCPICRVEIKSTSDIFKDLVDCCCNNESTLSSLIDFVSNNILKEEYEEYFPEAISVWGDCANDSCRDCDDVIQKELLSYIVEEYYTNIMEPLYDIYTLTKTNGSRVFEIAIKLFCERNKDIDLDKLMNIIILNGSSKKLKILVDIYGRFVIEKLETNTIKTLIQKGYTRCFSVIINNVPNLDYETLLNYAAFHGNRPIYNILKNNSNQSQEYNFSLREKQPLVLYLDLDYPLIDDNPQRNRKNAFGMIKTIIPMMNSFIQRSKNAATINQPLTNILKESDKLKTSFKKILNSLNYIECFITESQYGNEMCDLKYQDWQIDIDTNEKIRRRCVWMSGAITVLLCENKKRSSYTYQPRLKVEEYNLLNNLQRKLFEMSIMDIGIKIEIV